MSYRDMCIHGDDIRRELHDRHMMKRDDASMDVDE